MKFDINVKMKDNPTKSPVVDARDLWIKLAKLKAEFSDKRKEISNDMSDFYGKIDQLFLVDESMDDEKKSHLIYEYWNEIKKLKIELSVVSTDYKSRINKATEKMNEKMDNITQCVLPFDYVE